MHLQSRSHRRNNIVFSVQSPRTHDSCNLGVDDLACLRNVSATGFQGKPLACHKDGHVQKHGMPSFRFTTNGTLAGHPGGVSGTGTAVPYGWTVKTRRSWNHFLDCTPEPHQEPEVGPGMWPS